MRRCRTTIYGEEIFRALRRQRLVNRDPRHFQRGLARLRRGDETAVVAERCVRHAADAVSYTHLDVYKRQGFCGATSEFGCNIKSLSLIHI